MRARYTIYVCPECEESFQYAGFCDSCQVRLQATSCIPASHISATLEAAKNKVKPETFRAAAWFVKKILGG